MRRGLVLLMLLVMVMPRGVAAQDGGAHRASGDSPLAGRCAANDRTVLYGAESDLEEEVSVAVNPRQPNHMVVAWAQDMGLGIVTASTFDGGHSWTRVVVPGLSVCTGGRYDRVIHPRLSFGPDGVLFLLTSPLDGFFPDPRSAAADLAVTRSFDGGRTWAAPKVLNDLPVFNDLGGMTAEPDVPGGAVVVWSEAEAVADTMYVSRTTDHGATWTQHQVRDVAPANLAGKVVVAHPSGALLVFVREDPMERFLGVPLRPRPLSVLRSTDKGASWGSAVQLVADADAYFWPLAAAAPDGPTYLVWGTNTPDGRRQLKLRVSKDVGLTWGAASDVVTVDMQSAVTMEPSIAAGANGLVALAHYAKTAEGLSVLLTKSSDGGKTWMTTRVAGPFQEAFSQHPVLGPSPRGYQLDVDVHGQSVTTGFVGSGALAARGLTDAYAVTTRP